MTQGIIVKYKDRRTPWKIMSKGLAICDSKNALPNERKTGILLTCISEARRSIAFDGESRHPDAVGTIHYQIF